MGKETETALERNMFVLQKRKGDGLTQKMTVVKGEKNSRGKGWCGTRREK